MFFIGLIWVMTQINNHSYAIVNLDLPVEILPAEKTLVRLKFDLWS